MKIPEKSQVKNPNYLGLGAGFENPKKFRVEIPKSWGLGFIFSGYFENFENYERKNVLKKEIIYVPNFKPRSSLEQMMH